MRRYLFFALCFLSIILQAQENELSVLNTQIGRYREYYPDDLSELQWRPGTAAYSYNTYEKVIIKDLADETKEASIDLLKVIEGCALDYGVTIRYLSHLWIDSTDVFLYRDNLYMRYSLLVDSVKYTFKLPEDAGDITVSPNGNFIAYTLNSNLYVVDSLNSTIQISNDSIDGIVNGEVVHRNEFGIEAGIFWSPMSDKLAFYRKDETMVEQYPLVDITTSIASVNNIRYPMAGRKSHEVTIGVFTIQSKSTSFLKTGSPVDRYFSNVTWDENQQSIYIQELNRQQNNMQLKKYDLTNLEGKTIYEEHNEKYVEPQYPLYFIKSQPGNFIYHGHTDGYYHLYLFTTEGKLVKQITKGEWQVLDFLGADKKSVYYLSTKESSQSVSICKTDVKTGNTTVLNRFEGANSAILNYKAGLLINKVNNRQLANKIEIINTKGELEKELLNSMDKFNVFQLGKEQEGTIKAADGETDLYYRMILPQDFDSTKKYPVIVYTYGGPHAQVVLNEYYSRTDLWMHYMAQNGYIGFMLDNRGSAHRGMEFENVTHRKLGVEEMKDQLKGVAFLTSHEFVDSTRLGIYGWSFGGYMTTSLMTTYPGVFNVAACGGPVINWELYEVMYGERYMDMPQENPEGYELTNVANKAKNLEGKLLVIHGAQDPVVVWQNSLQFVRACIEANKQVDYFVYPTHEHGVRGMDYVHLMTKISNYFFDNL